MKILGSDIPKEFKWKEFTNSQKVIAIFGFIVPIFWIIYFQREKGFDEKSIKWLFVFGFIHIINWCFALAILIS